MTKIDIYSGFLGAGKTTLIKKMISEGYKGQKLVLIENEFGEIGIDGGFLQDAGINITEMNSGCICCSLVGDFGKALTQVIDQYHPDRILIEPSGVGKLSDVIGAVKKVTGPEVSLGYTVAVVDAGKVKVYMKNFGEFYNNQVETASTVILSRTDSIPQAKLDAAVSMLREHNEKATIVTTPWGQLTGDQLIAAMEGQATLARELAHLEEEHHEHHHHHHDEDCCCGHDHEHEHHHHHDEDCCCGHDHEHEHHHHHDEDCCCGHDHDHEHHHHHDEDCCCGHDHDHEHHHHHDETCTCGCHDHDHHDHHADEVFTSWGVETAKKFEKSAIEAALHELDSGKYGMILRAKGILPAADGTWIHFDFVPEEHNVRLGAADITGKLCVIGSKLDEHGLHHLFGGVIMQQIPVYSFTGFLDSGKTKFIQETLEDERFNAGERTLLLVFEEGEEEYDFSTYPHKNVYLEVLDQQTISTKELQALTKKYRAQRIVLELNGMQQVGDLYMRFPENWVVAQEVMFADSTTIMAYNNNMRNLVMDKLVGAQMVVFNRLTPGADVMPFHKLARAASRRIDILYDYTDGSTSFDDIEDPLPFDINAPIIDIKDEDYALWYRDCTEEPEKYDGKTVRFKAQVAMLRRDKNGMFAPGRFVMTCCVEDIQFCGIPCRYEQSKTLESRSWVMVMAKVTAEKHPLYKGDVGPVLNALEVTQNAAPADPDVATF